MAKLASPDVTLLASFPPIRQLKSLVFCRTDSRDMSLSLLLDSRTVGTDWRRRVKEIVNIHSYSGVEKLFIETKIFF